MRETGLRQDSTVTSQPRASMPSVVGMDDARLGSLGRTSHQEVMPEAAGQGAIPSAPAPVAAGEGAAPTYGPQQALNELAPLNYGTFQQLRDILARVQPPIPWLNDPNSPQYREVFIGLDPQVQPAFPGIPLNFPFSVNKRAAEFYLLMMLPPRGGRKKLSRKRNARSRRTRRDSERGRTRRSRRTGGRT